MSPPNCIPPPAELFTCSNCKDAGIYLNYPELKDMPSFCWCAAGREALRQRRIEYLKNKANAINPPADP